MSPGEPPLFAFFVIMEHLYDQVYYTIFLLLNIIFNAVKEQKCSVSYLSLFIIFGHM